MPQWTSATVQTGGYSVHYRQIGSGNPPLLLLHGIGSTNRSFEPLGREIGGSHRCLAMDLPGYGASDDQPYDAWGPLVAACEAVLGHARAHPCHVVGSSAGALLALALCRTHPDSVLSLTLIGPTLGRGGELPDRRREWLEARLNTAANQAAGVADRAAQMAGPNPADGVLEILAAEQRRLRPTGYSNLARLLANTNATEWLADIRRPTLVLCGNHDVITGPAVGRLVADHIPAARLVFLAGVGHAAHVEQPKTVAKLMSSHTAQA